MVADFSSNFLKSLKAFSISQFKDWNSQNYPTEEELDLAATKFQSDVKPLLTNAGFGSFKFSLAMDFMPQYREDRAYRKLKSNILVNYQENIFSQELTDENIDNFKRHFTADEIEDIFKPIFHIRSPKSPYKVAYVDRENLRKVYLPRTKNLQRVKLLPIRTINKEDIGVLMNFITHQRSTATGRQQSHVILKEQLNKWSVDKRTNLISPSIRDPFVLNEEIIINASFDTEVGFTFSYEELPLEATSTTFEDAETKFYDEFVRFIRHIINKTDRDDLEQDYYVLIKRLISNPDII